MTCTHARAGPAVSTDGNCIVVAPAHDLKRRRKFSEALKKVNNQWGEALKRLAK